MVHVPPEAVEAIAQRAAELVIEQVETASRSAREWLSVEAAAEYLGCNKQRIYELRSAGRLPRHREGGRAIVRRADLDALVTIVD
jgi:excisionase family DNA binding protein